MKPGIKKSSRATQGIIRWKETAEAITRNLLKRNRPIEEIIEDTGLTGEQIEMQK